MAGCEDRHFEFSIHENLTICISGVELAYDYNEENSTYENKINYWVRTIDEYVFDESDRLYSVRQLTPDGFDSKIILPEGRYSVVAVGNIDERSAVSDFATGGFPVVGVTRRQDLRLSLQNPGRFEDGTVGPSEDLFYGYRTFSVGATDTGRVRVDLVNAHLRLRFRVRWADPHTELNAGSYYAVLEGVTSLYDLVPEWMFPADEFSAREFDHSMAEFPSDDQTTVHYLPRVAPDPAMELDYSEETYLNADREIRGVFTTYRIRSDTPLTMTLHYAPTGTRASDSDPMMLPRAIDLRGFFEWFNIDLDHALKQDYVLDVLVVEDRMVITLVDGGTVADWTEGGEL